MLLSENQKTNQSYVDANQYEYIVVIGTSTGGPKALNAVITALSDTLPATYVVVQHMPEGFTKSLAERLDQLSQVKVKEADNGEMLKQGTVYIAPGGKQLKIVNTLKPSIMLTDEPPYKSHKPSVNIMCHTLAVTKPSKKIIGVIMTGMGSDGLDGLTDLKTSLDATIIAQNQATAIVYGMPKVVVEAGIADYVVPLDQIAQTIKKIMGE